MRVAAPCTGEPDVNVAVTVCVLSLVMTLPNASSSLTTGCWAKATPAVAVAEGCVVITSWLAAWLTPTFSWRILWLLGLPTGMVLILLNRWIPESPRYLLARGKNAEAEAVMARYGITEMPVDEPADAPVAVAAGRPSPGVLFRSPLVRRTVPILLYGLSWGMINWTFITFLPTLLQQTNTGVAASGLLFRSELFALPTAVVAAVLYARWSSQKTLVLCAGLGWTAAEAAATLETTTAAVNSALQRARAVLRDRLPRDRAEWTAGPLTVGEQDVLRQFIDVHERGDAAAAVAMMRADIVATMPPQPMVYRGRAAMGPLLKLAFAAPQAGGMG